MLFNRILELSKEMSKEEFELMLKVADEDMKYSVIAEEHKIIKILEQSKRVAEACEKFLI